MQFISAKDLDNRFFTQYDALPYFSVVGHSGYAKNSVIKRGAFVQHFYEKNDTTQSPCIVNGEIYIPQFFEEGFFGPSPANFSFIDGNTRVKTSKVSPECQTHYDTLITEDL